MSWHVNIKSLFRFLAWVAREIRLQARDLHSTPRQPISLPLHRHVSSFAYIRCQYRTSAALSRFMTSSDSHGPRFCCLIGSACRYQRNGPEESTCTALERATLLFGSLLHKVSLTETLKISLRAQLIVRQSMTIRSIHLGRLPATTVTVKISVLPELLSHVLDPSHSPVPTLR